MINKSVVLSAFILVSFAAATPASAFGPGGLARGLASVISPVEGNVALPQASRASSHRYCAAFGTCLEGRSIAIKASWNAGRDALMPLDRLELTNGEAERVFAAMRFEISPFAATPAPARREENVDYGVLTGSVSDSEPL